MSKKQTTPNPVQEQETVPAPAIADVEETEAALMARLEALRTARIARETEERTSAIGEAQTALEFATDTLKGATATLKACMERYTAQNGGAVTPATFAHIEAARLAASDFAVAIAPPHVGKARAAKGDGATVSRTADPAAHAKHDLACLLADAVKRSGRGKAPEAFGERARALPESTAFLAAQETARAMGASLGSGAPAREACRVALAALLATFP